MNFKYLTRANLIIFILYAAFLGLGASSEFFKILKAFFGFVIILISGLNLAILLKITFKKNFDFAELMNLTFLNIIMLIPFILLIENALLKRTYALQSISTLSLIMLSTIVVLFIRKKKNAKEFLFEFPPFTIKKILTSPLTHVVLLEMLIIFATVFLYKFLPDKDPFTWYVRLTQYFENNVLSNFSYRPLFYSTSFLFNSLTGINIFVFLKYVIPILFLSIFLPIWMVARKINEPKRQLIILLVPFLTPNAILYSILGMPQVFFMILLYYFVFFLFYSYFNKDKFYYYTTGIIATACALYHEAGIIIISIWIIVTLAYEWKKIVSNKKDVLFIFIIIFSNLSIIITYINFIAQWSKEIATSFLHPHFNYTFPIKYRTIDAIEAGSQSIIGVVKTYLGYVGPVIIFSALIILYLLFKKNIVIEKYWMILKKSREFQIIFMGFFIFFTIAEILPRFPGIALLPDRAWIFASIFFSFFMLLFVFKTSDRGASKEIYYIYIACIFLSIGGAIYGNYQKKYLITDDQMQSAEWIKQKLPENRIIVSNEHNQLIQYFSQSKTFNVDADFFYDKENLNARLDNLKNEISNNIKDDNGDNKLKIYINNIISKTNKSNYIYLNSKDVKEKNDTLKDLAENNIKFSQDLINSLNSPPPTNKSPAHIYIYYTEPNNKSLFFDDLYIKNNDSVIFNKFPDKFEKVYNNSNDNIMIWKVL